MRIIYFFMVLFLSMVVAFVFCFNIPVNKIFSITDDTSKVFRISKGESIHSISKRLKADKLILSDKIFQYGARLTNLDKSIRYGDFNLHHTMSIYNILKKITSNNDVKYNIYIRECITSWEIVELLKQNNFVINDLSDDKLEEGIFAPDTYAVSYKTRATDFLKLIHRKQTERLNNVWLGRQANLPIDNKFELLILASLIEKEAADVEEMAIVSSVFVNRLKKGMRLQSDPTVTYGIDLGNTSLRKPLKKSDLRVDSLHNTYRRLGLPVSPICNPSEKAIQAAANPTATEYFYFVMSESGEHVFAETFEEHKRNVSKWRMHLAK